MQEIILKKLIRPEKMLTCNDMFKIDVICANVARDQRARVLAELGGMCAKSFLPISHVVCADIFHTGSYCCDWSL